MPANQLVVSDKPKSVLISMSDRYGMEPAAFEQTLRATVVPRDCSREQFAAFLLVANEYGLNPITREIYAFPARGGGIVPIVSIDGWVSLVNSHKACDGFEFDVEHGEDNTLISITCKIYRKDRKYPVTVTEYLSECKRPTDPWKMPHRMLRHKAMIQAARYAFGFSGIYDEDEGRVIADAGTASTQEPRRVPSPSAPPEIIVDESEAQEVRADDPITSGHQSTVPPPAPPKAKSSNTPDHMTDLDSYMAYCIDKLGSAQSGEELEAFFNDNIEAVRAQLFPGDYDELLEIYQNNERKFEA